MLIASPLIARENMGMGITDSNGPSYRSLATDCNDATGQIDLNVNNARVRLLGAGDFWWDLTDAVYVIPKVDPTTGAIEVSSMFAGALWIGGIDAGGQLKIAAQTYRQSGNDFWPGPLNDDGSVNQDVCSAYDLHWKVEATDVSDLIGESLVSNPVPLSWFNGSAGREAILSWPAKGNPYAQGKNSQFLNVERNLAPYVDVNADGLYDPTTGDYPDIDGDQAIFWVYNDKGNIHTETGGDAIGLEIQALAFGFKTSDEINDMTFYKYKVLNFSSSPLDSTYFGQWVDADLGAFDDDFVGCDTALSLGMCYNGDASDGPTAPNYGASPPIIGTDFFKGPKKFFNTTVTSGPDSGNVVRDSIELGMSAFLYYDNDFSITGNPEVAAHFYGYLSGTWKDGTPFTRGGNGYGGTEPSNFLFPDPPGLTGPDAWSECAVGNTPFDRRYLQSAGPFRLEPGAKNEVVIGVVWVSQDAQTGCSADFDLIKAADEKAQALFDSDFDLIDGPDAPDITIREFDKEIVLQLSNSETSNNIGEAYEETDPIIRNIVANDQTGTITDSTYNFEGYIIYQLADAQVSASDYDNPERARIVAQVDLKNEIDKLVNLTFDNNLGADVPVLMVDGADEGILHSFNVQEDLFATGDRGLVNHRTYYFSVVAYSHNNFKDYDPSDPNTQKLPYLQGRRNIKVYTAIPHITAPENNGTTLNSSWGDGPEVVRIEGMGNGGRILEVTDASADIIVQSSFDPNVTYQGRLAPVDVMVADPLLVPAADFEIVFTDTSSAVAGPLIAEESYWEVTNLTSGETVRSEFGLDVLNEQLIEEWGITITAAQSGYPGGFLNGDGIFEERAENNGFLEATIEYEDASQSWLTGVPDGEGASSLNWIGAGISSDPPVDVSNVDNNQIYESVLGGTWAPAKLVLQEQPTTIGNITPFGTSITAITSVISMNDLHSIDLVFTADKDKWSRVPVVETSPEGLSIYEKNKLKLEPSKGKDGNPDGTGVGQSWFPGYAIDLETGERLNIVMGESTWLGASNGNDMIWNPTDEFRDPLFNAVYGGGHFIYVQGTRYDEGLTFTGQIQSGSPADERNAWRPTMWVSMPYVSDGFSLNSVQEGIIPTTTTVRLRVTQPLARFTVDGSNNGVNKYQFSTQGLAPVTNDLSVAETACDLINVVPNPYYAFSEYENSSLDNRIKITNLPPKCVVSVYMMDGTLIRRFNRDVAADNTSGGALNSSNENFDTTLEWDLKNDQQVPVASGIYLIHVEAEGLCERTLKWLGVMRPIDLDTF